MEIFIICIALVSLAIWPFAFRSRGHTASTPAKDNTSQRDSHALGGMNEGDYHSGPDGYSANTAYPDSQYGSLFDDEAEWNR